MTDHDGIRVSISLSRKVNLGNYESADAFISLSDVPVGATEEEIEDALDTGRLVWERMKPRLIAQAREGARAAGMPEQLRRFSHSLIDTYLDCPRKAYYRYVEGIDSPKSSALVTGSACDSAWNRALDRKIFGQDPPTVDELKSWTEAAFRADVAEQGGKHAIEWGEGEHGHGRARAGAPADGAVGHGAAAGD